MGKASRRKKEKVIEADIMAAARAAGYGEGASFAYCASGCQREYNGCLKSPVTCDRIRPVEDWYLWELEKKLGETR